jgi:hypothetical protein
MQPSFTNEMNEFLLPLLADGDAVCGLSALQLFHEELIHDMNSEDFSVIFCRPVYRFFEGDPAVFGEINSDDDSMEGFHGMTGLVFEWASLPEKAGLCANRIALFRLSLLPHKF